MTTKNKVKNATEYTIKEIERQVIEDIIEGYIKAFLWLEIKPIIKEALEKRLFDDEPKKTNIRNAKKVKGR